MADHLFQGRHLVVLAPEAQHQHGARIGVTHQRGQRPLRIGVVVAQLRTTVIMGVDPHVVEVRAVALALHALRDGLRLPVDAPHRGHDPQLVANAHRIVPAQVTHHPHVALRAPDIVNLGGIGVFEVVAEVGFQVVRVNPPALRHVLRGVTDGIAVLHDVLARGDVAQGELMAARNVLAERHGDALDIERLALVQVVGQCDGDIVRSVDFQKPFHINKISRMSGSRKAPAEAGVRGWIGLVNTTGGRATNRPKRRTGTADWLRS